MTDIWKVIVSCKSGGGKALKQWNETIKELLVRKKIEFSVSITERQHHAIELASKALKEGFRKFIAIGGDGAIHEILNGICQQTEVPTSEVTLAIIPVGSGNDWSRLYKIPQNKPLKAINAIVRNKVVRQDIAKVSSFDEDGTPLTRYMINIGGVGFDAEVCRQFDRAKKRGKASDVQYLKSLMRSFFFYMAKRSTVKVDDEVFFDGPVFSVAFGVGKYCGGGMSQLPDADPQDGLLNVTVVKRVPKLKFLTSTPKLYNGSIYSMKEVIHTTCRKLEMESSIPCPVEVDGENVGINPVTVEIIPNAIRVITNM